MPTHTGTSLNVAELRKMYWIDNGMDAEFGVVRTQADIIRELHYKLGMTLLTRCRLSLRTLKEFGWSDDLGTFLGELDLASSHPVRLYIEREYNPHTEQWDTDTLGNIAAYTKVRKGNEKPQFDPECLTFLDRLGIALNSALPVNAAERMKAEMEVAKKVAAEAEAKADLRIVQTKALLKEETAMKVRLEKVLLKSGIELPQQCLCGEIRCEEEETEVVEYPPRMVLVYDEHADQMVMEAETSGGRVEYHKPMWFHHYVGEEQQDEGACRKCVLGDIAQVSVGVCVESGGKGKCSPCFDPQPKKVEPKVGIKYGKGFEYFTPQCFCCVSPLGTSNCFAWNKNRYLILPQLGECVKELVPTRKIRKGEFDSITPSEVIEIQRDAEIPVSKVMITGIGGTEYYGDYDYRNVASSLVAVQGL